MMMVDFLNKGERDERRKENMLKNKNIFRSRARYSIIRLSSKREEKILTFS